jgi:phospholipase C
MHGISTLGRRLIVLAVAFSLAACGGGNGGLGSSDNPPGPARGAGALARLRPSSSSGKIQHVVIIVQENRSFDNLFHGAKGADTRSYGFDSSGQKIKLVPIGLETNWDLDHSSTSFFQACDGQGSFPGTNCKMDGFDKESTGCRSGCPYAHPQYAYVPRSESQPYFDMAKHYVLADRMFASNFDASSFISHQYIIAGQAGQSAVNYPSSTWGCDGGPGDTIGTVSQQRQVGGPSQVVCWDDQTLGDELDAAKISWGFYTASLNGDGNIWSAYQAIKHIRYGNDWTNGDIVTPQTHFFDAIQNNALPTVSWVTPTCENSDHAGCGANTGPQWVASLVNAVGQSKYWNSTAIFIMWDDYGGWYDHVPPPLVDYDGLGMRIPLLIISPYAKKGFVSHVQYEHGSILRFIEDQFGLGRLSASDTRANSPEADCFDFSKPPRSFSPIPSVHDAQYFIHRPLDRRPPDTQ